MISSSLPKIAFRDDASRHIHFGLPDGQLENAAAVTESEFRPDSLAVSGWTDRPAAGKLSAKASAARLSRGCLEIANGEKGGYIEQVPNSTFSLLNAILLIRD